MTIKQIENILKQHSVPYYIENGCTYVDSMISNTEVFERVENVTRWSKRKLYTWLGY